MPRTLFHAELARLKTRVAIMADLVEKAVNGATAALSTRQVDVLPAVFQAEQQINEEHHTLLTRAMLLVATQQPCAHDLRLVFSASQVAAELERMGDHALSIARIAQHLASGDEPQVPTQLATMAQCSMTLLRANVAAYLAEDIRAADRLVDCDEEVDELYRELHIDMMESMRRHPNTVQQANELVRAAHDLERIADRSSNIGEQVQFLVTGQIDALNPKREEIL